MPIRLILLTALAALSLPLAGAFPVDYSFVLYTSGNWTICPATSNVTCGVMDIGSFSKGANFRFNVQCSTFVEDEMWRAAVWSDTDGSYVHCAIRCTDESGASFNPSFYTLLSSGQLNRPMALLVTLLFLVVVPFLMA